MESVHDISLKRHESNLSGRISDVESVSHAVRNAFVHGSFEVVSPVDGERVHLLETARG